MAKASIIAVVGLLTDAEKNLNLSPGPELQTDPLARSRNPREQGEKWQSTSLLCNTKWDTTLLCYTKRDIQPSSATTRGKE